MIQLEVSKPKFDHCIKMFEALKKENFGSLTVSSFTKFLAEKSKVDKISMFIGIFFERLGRTQNDNLAPEEFTSGIAVENYLRRLFSPNSRDPAAK